MLPAWAASTWSAFAQNRVVVRSFTFLRRLTQPSRDDDDDVVFFDDEVVGGVLGSSESLAMVVRRLSPYFSITSSRLLCAPSPSGQARC